MTSTRGTEYVPLADLQPDPRNPKNHSVGVIEESMSRFGLIDQIVRDDRTGYIISGHGRTKTLRALQEAGEPAPAGVQVSDDGTWLVPVTVGWASKDDAEAGAALVALNRTTELGGWDDEALHEILEGLTELEDGLVGVGYSETDSEDLGKHLYGHTPDDLDDLADSWDGTGLGDSEGLETLKLRVSSETVKAWEAGRGTSSDDAHLKKLLGL